MIGEHVVLFRIKHLQQGGRRIAAEIGPQLVQLVQHEHRVVRSRLLETLDDPPRQCADVGAAMAANLRFVPHATKGHPDELAPHRPGDRLAERGFAHPRRADETEDRPLHLLAQLAYRQELKYPLLYLFKAVVVLVEHCLGLLDVEGVPGRLAPGDLHHPVEEGPEHPRFGRIRMHLFKAPQLFQRFLLDMLRHARMLDRLPDFGNLLGTCIGLTQLLLDCPELLTQVVFPLALPHLLLGSGLDAGLHAEQFMLLGQQLIHLLQTLHRIEDLQQRLRLLNPEADIAGDQVSQAPHILHVFHDYHHLGGNRLAEGDDLAELILHRPDQRLGFQGLLRRRLLHDPLDPDLIAWLLALVGEYPGLGKPLDQYLHPAVGELEHAHDHCHRPDGVDRIRGRILLPHILLRGEENQPVPGQSLVNRIYGYLPADEQRKYHVRIDNHIPDWQKRQQIGYFQLLRLRHCFHFNFHFLLLY